MMMGSNLMDGIDCASFFDQIDDLIDFLPEDKCEGDIVGANGGLVNSGGFPVMWDDDVPNPDVFLSKNSSADLSGELYVPYEDIVQLEWISNFVEDSFSNEGFGLGKDAIDKKDNNNSSQLFQVLESSSSSSSSSSNSTNSASIETKPNNGIPPCGPQRARSKRPRPPAFNPRPAIQLVEAVTFSENFVESDPPHEKIPEESDDRETKKKKKMKTGDEDDVSAHHQPQQAAAPRKCAHCEITKTPQWRAGPGGPKTLCNACGVRYKSGRLFPEYRPAASPTFVPSVHSNSHKKVVEMRNKKDDQSSTSNASVVINNDDNNRNNDA